MIPWKLILIVLAAYILYTRGYLTKLKGAI